MTLPILPKITLREIYSSYQAIDPATKGHINELHQLISKYWFDALTDSEGDRANPNRVLEVIFKSILISLREGSPPYLDRLRRFDQFFEPQEMLLKIRPGVLRAVIRTRNRHN